MLAQYYHILKDLMKYKSISPDAQYFPEMQGVATYLQKLFQEHKWEVEVVMGYGNPIIVASFATNKKNPTCLLYGHYDVQFADKSE
jgi:acetylornithine deacetylase/succinyl-diaminopimelate desuccinylase-like protein